MCLMVKRLLFSLQELRYVCITCQYCRTQIILDMADFPRPGSTERVPLRTTFTPKECPACKKPFDSALEHLNHFQAAYEQLQKLDAVVGFCSEGIETPWEGREKRSN